MFAYIVFIQANVRAATKPIGDLLGTKTVIVAGEYRLVLLNELPYWLNTIL
jgi:hypothetical protein